MTIQGSNLVDALRRRAEEQADCTAVRVLDGDTVTQVSFGGLDRRARQLAILLEERGLRGERVLLADATCLNYVAGFFACLYAGAIAVPAFPAARSQRSGHLDRLQSMVANSGARAALSSRASDAERPSWLRALDWICPDDPDTVDPESWKPSAVGRDQVAYLQYTSGSTRRPRGVMVTHGMLLTQSACTREAMALRTGDSFLNWLPLFHDFGLIGGVIHPLLQGCTTTMLSPAAFMHKPARWVQAISKYRVTEIGGPDFGYKLCADRTTEEEKAGLDLSCVKNAIVGADKIHARTLDQFTEAFRVCGFRGEALSPGYGLAESTLGVSLTAWQAPPVRRSVDPAELAAGRVVDGNGADGAGRTLVGCGSPFPGHHIRIVDPETGRPVPRGHLGEVWIAGPCVAPGYWQDAAETEAVFGATLPEENGRLFLRSGDLGFLDDGELFIAGRRGDRIVIRGANHFSWDIEATVAAAHTEFQPYGTVAFSVEDAEQDQLVVVQEIHSSRRIDYDDALKAVRRAILAVHGVSADAILLVKRGSIKRSSSGKIRREACRRTFLDDAFPVIHRWPATETGAPAQDHSSTDAPYEDIAALMLDMIASTLHLRREDLHPNVEWIELGLDSLKVLQLTEQFKALTGISLEPASLLDVPTVNDLARQVGREYGDVFTGQADDPLWAGRAKQIQVAASPSPRSGGSLPVAEDLHDIAVIGLGCRLPQATSPEAFWDNLRAGRGAVGEAPPDRWDWRLYADPDGSTPLRWGAWVADVDRFDADFFDLSAGETVQMDPQQRLFLEVVWEAIERAGYRPATLARAHVGLYVGVSTHDYAEIVRRREGIPDSSAATGNAAAFLANRVSYLLDFRGPSLAVDTACSSSLVALHLAVQSVRQGECGVAIAGGVNLTLDPEISLIFARSGLLARDGHCRAFDDRADGYARGDAVAAVVVKPLVRAQEDGDPVLAVIKGSAVGHDGNLKIGFTAPSPKGQRRVALEAYRDAGIEPQSVEFIETHGTGTPLGDGIEFQGLKGAFETHTDRQAFCALGSVKTRVGHSEAAAGITSFMSAALALSHSEIPPNLNLAEPSRHIVFEDSPFYLNERRRPWPSSKTPRRAAVNSFGLGGTGAHVILEEAPRNDAGPETNPAGGDVLALSARTESALERLIRDYRDRLVGAGASPIHDICATANCGRSAFRYRITMVIRDGPALTETLARLSDGTPTEPDVVFRGDASDAGDSARFADVIERLRGCDAASRALVLECWRHPPAAAGNLCNPDPQPRKRHDGAPPAPERKGMLVCLAQLFALGADIDWDPLYRGRPRRVVLLPTYPFEGRRYWPDAAGSVPASPRPVAAPSLGEDALTSFLLAGLAAAAPDTAAAIDPETNLLDLGFDSIAATRLAFMLEQALGVRLSVIDLFEHHNVRALTEWLAPQVDEIPSLDDITGFFSGEEKQRDPGEPFASTPLQQAYLSARFLPRSIGGGGSQLTVDLEIPGALDLDRLQGAVRGLIQRHPMMRTVFLKDGRQRILEDQPDYSIESVDLRRLPEGEKTRRHQAFAQELATQVFDPCHWPLFYAKTTRLEEGSFHLLFGIDLLLVDFQSLSLLFDEMQQRYEDPDIRLEPLPFNFGDYMTALQGLRESERYAADRDWWRGRIQAFPGPPEIRRTGAVYGAQRAAFRSLSFEMPATQWDAVAARAQQHEISLSTILCAAFCETLHQWSGREAFCLNLPIFDRYPVHEKIDGVVGPFNNNILISVQWSSEADPWTQARRVQSECLAALEHRLFTGVEFSREIAQHRKSLADPVGPVVFTAAIHGGEPEAWGTPSGGTSETPQVWLDCQVIGRGNRATVRWDYDPVLFDEPVLNDQFRRFQECLAWMANGAGARGPSAPHLQPGAGPVQTLDRLVSEQAERTPHLRAVVCDGQYRTYADLESRSRAVAGALLRHGASPGDLVAVAMERGIEMIEAVLGILKAGCAYVPVDPEYPAHRVERLLTHSEARIVLTQPHRMEALPRSDAFVLDVTSCEAEPPPDDLPEQPRLPSDLAYVNYTSGSTGTPKGVMISHGAAINTIVDINQRFGVTKFDRVLGFSSLSFDLSVWDLFGTLSAGATLVILPRQSLKSPDRWMDLLQREGVTIWNSVPIGMKMLLDFCEGRRACNATTLRLVMLSGDWIPLSLPDRIKAFFGGPEVISLGGATEASIWSICYPVESVDPAWSSIPYGKPLAHQEISVRDEGLQPVVNGEVGEICIGGQGVAMGYYREPERTAHQFVADPATGRTLYRTGDRGRMQKDGNVEILGRMDSQVKIRGFRVELAEVEAAVQSHPGVDSGAITVRGSREDRQLVAYFVPKHGGASVSQLRSHLRSVLPDYMVPQKFVERSDMPLSPNGKIDRGALNESVT